MECDLNWIQIFVNVTWELKKIQFPHVIIERCWLEMVNMKKALVWNCHRRIVIQNDNY
jgi:hypothetical protein